MLRPGLRTTHPSAIRLNDRRAREAAGAQILIIKASRVLYGLTASGHLSAGLAWPAEGTRITTKGLLG